MPHEDDKRASRDRTADRRERLFDEREGVADRRDLVAGRRENIANAREHHGRSLDRSEDDEERRAANVADKD